MTPSSEGRDAASRDGTAPFLPIPAVVGAQPAENLALLTQDGYLTYGELNARANQLARALLDRGLDQAAPIGICLERSADFVVALLGVLRAGHPYLPFDARQPRNRVEELLQEARAGALLTHGSLFAEGTGPELPILRLDRERRALAREATAESGVPVAPEDLAYCMFTSGSTGRPKCVEVAHGGLAAYPGAFNARLGIDAASENLPAVRSDVANLDWIRDRIAHTLDDDDRSGIDTLIVEAIGAAGDEDFATAGRAAAQRRDHLAGVTRE